MKTPEQIREANRQKKRNERDRNHAKGLVLVSAWVPVEKELRVKKYLARHDGRKG